MIPVFDYRSLNEDHKKAAEEIANILSGMGQPMLAELVKLKFEVIDRPKYNLNDSPFIDFCKKAGLHFTIQGYTIDNGIEYPLVTLCEDIRKLNKLHEVMNNDNSSGD
jgi:hypothetical protein